MTQRELYAEVDPRCRALVDSFLPAGADEITRAAMAQNIQDVVDDWLLDCTAERLEGQPTDE